MWLTAILQWGLGGSWPVTCNQFQVLIIQIQQEIHSSCPPSLPWLTHQAHSTPSTSCPSHPPTPSVRQHCSFSPSSLGPKSLTLVFSQQADVDYWAQVKNKGTQRSLEVGKSSWPFLHTRRPERGQGTDTRLVPSEQQLCYKPEERETRKGGGGESQDVGNKIWNKAVKDKSLTMQSLVGGRTIPQKETQVVVNVRPR